LKVHSMLQYYYVFAIELFQFDYISVTFLFGVLKCVVKIDIGGFLIALIMLFSVLDHTGRAKRHKALLWVRQAYCQCRSW
jgi:hypothetical protein